MNRLLFSSLVVLALAGCGTDQATELSKGAELMPTWTELDALGGNTWQPIKMNSDFGDFAKAKEAALDPAFVKAYEDFKKVPTPGKYSTTEREAARKDYEANIDKLLEGAKSGASDADIKAAIDGAGKAMGKFMEFKEPAKK